MRSIKNRKLFAGHIARVVIQAALVLTAAAIMGCKTSPYPPAPQNAATPDYLYKLGPLDSVNVVVWRNPELSTSVTIRPDGKITAPLIEDLPALGRDSTTLARDIENALDTLVRLLSQLERHAGADPRIKELVGKAQEEVTHINRATANALALQREHDTWKKG